MSCFVHETAWLGSALSQCIVFFLVPLFEQPSSILLWGLTRVRWTGGLCIGHGLSAVLPCQVLPHWVTWDISHFLLLPIYLGMEVCVTEQRVDAYLICPAVGYIFAEISSTSKSTYKQSNLFCHFIVKDISSFARRPVFVWSILLKVFKKIRWFHLMN